MKPKLPNLVILLILTALTAALWVGLSVYRSISVKPAPIVPENILQSLNPVLDETAIKAIEAREVKEVVQQEQVLENVDADNINVDNLDIQTNTETELELQ